MVCNLVPPGQPRSTYSGTQKAVLYASLSPHVSTKSLLAPAAPIPGTTRLGDLKHGEKISEILSVPMAERVMAFNSVKTPREFPRCGLQAPVLVKSDGGGKVVAILLQIIHIQTTGAELVLLKILPFHYSEKKCLYLGLYVVEHDSTEFSVGETASILRRVRLVPADHIDEGVFYIAGKIHFSRFSSPIIPRQPSNRPPQRYLSNHLIDTNLPTGKVSNILGSLHRR